jgi:hypothetical protein
VAGAKVLLHYGPSGISDGSGEARFTGLVSGMILFEASAEGLASPQVARTLAGGDNEPIELFLGRTLDLEGRVVDVAGEPVVEATVSLWSGRPSSLSPWQNLINDQVRKVVASDQGEFRFPGGIVGDRYGLHATTPDYLDGSIENTVPPSEEGVVRVVIVLRRSSHIRGFVRDAAGRPVPDAEVQAGTRPDRGFPYGFAVTDAEGAFDLGGLRSGAVYRVRARKQGFGFDPEGEEVWLAPDATEARVDIALDTQGILNVRWHRADGGPAPESVFASLVVPGDGAPRTSYLDNRTRQRFLNLRAGRYRIGLNGGAAGFGMADVDVTAGAESEVDVEIGGDLALEGEVFDADGNVPRYFHMTLRLEPEGRDFSEGVVPGVFPTRDWWRGNVARPPRFEFHGLLPGTTWRIEARGPNGDMVLSEPMAAPARDLRLVLARASSQSAAAEKAPPPKPASVGSLRVEAWSARGIPLAGRVVVVQPKGEPFRRPPYQPSTDHTGLYRVTLPSGEYHIMILSGGGTVLCEGDATVPGGGETTTLVLREER